MKNFSNNKWNINIVEKNNYINYMNKYCTYYLSLTEDFKTNRLMLVSYAYDLGIKQEMEKWKIYRLVRQISDAKSIKTALRIFKNYFNNVKICMV